jgi:hypothetical protein
MNTILLTPPSTPKKPKCPDAPKRESKNPDFGYVTPVKRLFYEESIKCPWAPIKKNSSKKIYIRNENERVRIFFPLFDGKMTKRNLFGQPSKIPRLVKKTNPKFAESLKIKINLARKNKN